MINVRKRNGDIVPFEISKIKNAIQGAFSSCNLSVEEKVIDSMISEIELYDEMSVEEIQDQIEEILMDYDYPTVAKNYIIYRAERTKFRNYVGEKENFINIKCFFCIS